MVACRGVSPAEARTAGSWAGVAVRGVTGEGTGSGKPPLTPTAGFSRAPAAPSCSTNKDGRCRGAGEGGSPSLQTVGRYILSLEVYGKDSSYTKVSRKERPSFTRREGRVPGSSAGSRGAGQSRPTMHQAAGDGQGRERRIREGCWGPAAPSPRLGAAVRGRQESTPASTPLPQPGPPELGGLPREGLRAFLGCEGACQLTWC